MGSCTRIKVSTQSYRIISTICPHDQIITGTAKYSIGKICSLKNNIIIFTGYIIPPIIDNILSVTTLKQITIFFITTTIQIIVTGTAIQYIKAIASI